MIHNKGEHRKRDNRLLISSAIIILSILCLLYQANIVRLYIIAAVMREWEHFSEVFSVSLPNGPNQACFGYCAPTLPFFWGWIGTLGLISGVAILVYSWWKPRSSDRQ